MKPRAWGSLSSLVTALIGLFIVCAAPARASESALTLRYGEFVLDDGVAIPPDSAAWQRLFLPDNWNVSRPGVGGFGWYRLQFDLPERPHELYALYVRKLSMNAAFYVNGNYVADGGRLEEPVARHWNRPQFFTIPPHDLLPGHNTLHVRLYAYANNRGGLGEIELGPRAELQPRYELRFFVQTVLPQLCNSAVVALGFFCLVLWLRRRRESIHVFFFIFTLLWGIRSTHMFVRDIPVSAFFWDIWVQSSFGWCALLFLILALRYSGMRWPRVERLFVAYGVLGPILMYLAGPEGLHTVASNWSFVIVPVAIVFECILIRAAWRSRAMDSVLLAAAWGLIVAASVHDGLVHRNVLAFDSFYFVSYGMIVLSVVMAWILVHQFAAALDESERLNLQLEARVAQKHAELQDNFARLKAMERDHAISEERARIMSDMHDGLGSQLIGVLEMAEQSEVSTSELAGELRECLDSLRISIDSLEPTDNDLLTVLGNLRYRLEGRLKRRGIALDWQVSDVPRLESLTPQNVLHVLRIVQEAFTNIVKHAQARTITVQTGFTEQHVFLKIADDGRGFVRDREGRGLISMRNRARALAANLEIIPSPAGTTLSLYLARSA